MDKNWGDFLEDYKDMLKKYCYAICVLTVKKNEEGEWHYEGNITDQLYIMGGNFDEQRISDYLQGGDFPFDGVDKEGMWEFNLLIKVIKGDWEEPDDMELLHVESVFQATLEQLNDQEIHAGLFDFENDLFS